MWTLAPQPKLNLYLLVGLWATDKRRARGKNAQEFSLSTEKLTFTTVWQKLSFNYGKF